MASEGDDIVLLVSRLLRGALGTNAPSSQHNSFKDAVKLGPYVNSKDQNSPLMLIQRPKFPPFLHT